MIAGMGALAPPVTSPAAVDDDVNDEDASTGSDDATGALHIPATAMAPAAERATWGTDGTGPALAPEPALARVPSPAVSIPSPKAR